MRPVLALASLALLSGCSAFGDDLDAIDEAVLLSAGPSVESGPVLSLRTESDWGCGGEILVDEDTDPGRLALDVRGADALDYDEVTCITTSPLYAAVLLPGDAFRGAPVEVTVRHRGATDLYRYVPDAGGGTLAAVRTSTTRLGTP
jgi:hypothetical protein